MKICVVGNSHAGALKNALAVDDSAAGARFDFFVMPGGTGPHIQTDGNRLFAAPFMKDKVYATVAGAATDGLDLAEFDAVGFCAAGLPSHRNGDPDHLLNQIAFGASAPNPGPHRQLVSEAVMTRVMESALHDSPNFAAIREIRSVFAGPLIIQVCPLPTRALAAYRPESEKGSDLALQYGDRVWSFLSWYYRRQIGIISAFADSLGACVMSPDNGFIDAGFTPGKYGTPDPWHMNTAYGRLVLKGVLAAISSA